MYIQGADIIYMLLEVKANVTKIDYILSYYITKLYIVVLGLHKSPYMAYSSWPTL